MIIDEYVYRRIGESVSQCNEMNQLFTPSIFVDVVIRTCIDGFP